jgi:hemoglobin/transferrin/lactoferrin receptor protein
MKVSFTCVLLLFSVIGFSQIQKDTTKLSDVVAFLKLPAKKELIPYQFTILTSKDIEFQNFQNTADVLSNSGSLFVQKSQQGGGSPSIRGFEASRVLLLVDGVRMNNLIFRAGHLQNVITVDESLLDNVGVFYGPASTLFGSDALGGAVAMTTKKVKFSNEVEYKFTGSANTRYSSVNNEKSVAFNLNYATGNFASFSSVSFNDFGDLKMGEKKNRNSDYFGERLFYVATINGIDQILANDDKYVQKNTGYKQYNFMQKFGFKTNSGFEHNVNLQYSTSSVIPRYDRLTETNVSTGLTHAQWYYGPQERLLAIYTLKKVKAFFETDVQVNIAFQNAKESRHNRRFGVYSLQNRVENVNMFSVAVDLTKKFEFGELLYGFESYYETLNSSAFANDIRTGAISLISTRYPNGENQMIRNDMYVSYNSKYNYNTFVNAGVRIGFTSLNSTLADNSFFSLPFNQIAQDNLIYSGSIGIVKNTSKTVSLKANVSSGFRVPNIDDLAKIFESVQGTLIVPNSNLKPEKTVTADLGFVIQSLSKKVKFQNTYFYTRLFDAIVTSPFLFNGSNKLVYDGTLSEVFANQNRGKAFVTGLSTSLYVKLLPSLNLDATFNYSLGRIVDKQIQAPLDHIAPYFGKIGFTYSKSVLNLEVYLLFNGKKNKKDYAASGEDNLQYAPANGMPAWKTYNFKSSIALFPRAILFWGLENILDLQYRTFSSGINAPGRNIYCGLKYDF